MQHGLTRVRRLCLDVSMLLISVRQPWPEERLLLTPLSDAKQRATPIPKAHVRNHAAGEFRRRPDPLFVCWPFRTSNLPEFPSPAQRSCLVFVSTEILLPVPSGRAQDFFESSQG